MLCIGKKIPISSTSNYREAPTASKEVTSEIVPINILSNPGILIIKPTRCTNLSNFFLELNSTCFGQFLCPSTGVFHCTHSNGISHTGL
jgi:hypothetical protein